MIVGEEAKRGGQTSIKIYDIGSGKVDTWTFAFEQPTSIR